MSSGPKEKRGARESKRDRRTRPRDGVALGYGLTLDIYIHNIGRMLRSKFGRLARAEGLTRSQWQVLNRLSLDRGVHLSALAEMLEVELITAGRLVDKLEQLGWVERRPSRADKRMKEIFMLEAATEVQKRMHELANRLHEETFSIFSQEEYSELERLLEKLHGWLSASSSAEDTLGQEGEAA